MSEYTTFYLKEKKTPLLEYRVSPSWDKIENLSEDEMERIKTEIDVHNDKVDRSLGCELFYLSTTLSRELTFVSYSLSPKVLTVEVLQEIIDFYKEEIDESKKAMAKLKETITRLEARISKANLKLYEKLNRDIEDSHESISCWEEEIEKHRYWYTKFELLLSILQNNRNEEYELVYTKC